MLLDLQGRSRGPGARVATVTVWLVASRLLGRPVPVDEPYPHIEGLQVGVDRDRVTPIIMFRNGCAACATDGYRPKEKRR